MDRVSTAVIATLLTVALLGGAVAADPGPQPRDRTGPEAALWIDGGLDRPDPRTLIRINVTRNGDANVAIESRFEVNESVDRETQSFETLYRDVRDGEVQLLYDVATMRDLVADVSATTGRQMAVENARWTRSIRNGTGVIALRFRWTNFGIDRPETVVVGDAFQTASGSWLPTLADGQRLVIRAPEGYTVLSPSDSVGQKRLTWEGPYRFQSGSPSATFGGSVTTPGTTTPGDPGPGGTTATTPDGTTEAGGSPLFWIALLVAVLSVGGGGYWYFSEHDDDLAAGTTSVPASDGSENAETDPVETGDGGEPDPPADAESESDDDEDGDADGEADVDDGGIDPELLSDEERVEHLLEQNGGRMKQAQIVKETGWSNAKVSQLLSSMDDEDRIDKLRIGRENLITLPDEDVADV